MVTIEERVRSLADNLEVDGKPLRHPLDLDLNVTEVGVASVDIVAFWKLVNEEFGVEVPSEDLAKPAYRTEPDRVPGRLRCLSGTPEG